MMCSPRRAAGSHSIARTDEKHKNMSLPVRWPIVLALLMPILCSPVFAATVGDPVELKATH